MAKKLKTAPTQASMFSSLLLETVSSRFSITEGDLPVVGGQGSSTMTFFECFRTALGTNPEWSFLAYRRSGELEAFSDHVFSSLSKTLGRRADTWLSVGVQSVDEAVALVREASDSIDSKEIPHVEERPGIRRVMGQGKPRAAVAVEACVIGNRRGIPFAAVLAEFMNPQGNDRKLIDDLEREAGGVEDASQIDWSIAKAFTISSGNWLRNSERTSVHAFCEAISADLNGLSDKQLQARLDSFGIGKK